MPYFPDRYWDLQPDQPFRHRVDAHDYQDDAGTFLRSLPFSNLYCDVGLGKTYTAATGGATAANDITLYQNGAVIASTATNAGTYVAMENGTEPVEIGSNLTHTANYFDGSMALVAVCQKALSAADHLAIHTLCRSYFGVP